MSLEFWRTEVFGATHWQPVSAVCVGLLTPRKCLRGDDYGCGERAVGVGASLGQRGSVSGVEIHSAGAQAPALPEIAAAPSLTETGKQEFRLRGREQGSMGGGET